MVEARVGQIVYKLALPGGSWIHLTFHASQLKKHIGKPPTSTLLPLVGTNGSLSKEPMTILDRRMVRKGIMLLLKF